MVEIKVKVDTHRLESAFAKKGAAVNGKIDQLTSQMVDVLQRWIQAEAPRKTGKLKASVQKQTYGSRGLVFLSKAVAPHWVYVIFGTRAHIIRAKHKKALKVPGFGVFKSVQHPGTKANPFVDKGAQRAEGEIQQKINAFEKWLTEV
jgi:hypothetical protein